MEQKYENLINNLKYLNYQLDCDDCPLIDHCGCDDCVMAAAYEAIETLLREKADLELLLSERQQKEVDF